MSTKNDLPAVLLIPLYKLDNNWEILQYYNRLISSFASSAIHFSIIFGLLIVNKFRLKNDYQILIIIQSIINLVSILSDLLFNEIQTINYFYIKIGHTWWNFNPIELVAVGVTVSVSANSTQDFLALFNLHRLFIFTKKNRLLRLYCIMIPLMLASVWGDSISSIKTLATGQDLDLFFKYTQLPIIIIIIIYCYWKLNKHFKENNQISEKTKRLQRKLSKSILLQIGILTFVSIITFLIPLIILSSIDIANQLNEFIDYLIIKSMIVQWYPLLSALTISWSITGFFTIAKTIQR